MTRTIPTAAAPVTPRIIFPNLDAFVGLEFLSCCSSNPSSFSELISVLDIVDMLSEERDCSIMQGQTSNAKYDMKLKLSLSHTKRYVQINLKSSTKFHDFAFSLQRLVKTFEPKFHVSSAMLKYTTLCMEGSGFMSSGHPSRVSVTKDQTTKFYLKGNNYIVSKKDRSLHKVYRFSLERIIIKIIKISVFNLTNTRPKYCMFFFGIYSMGECHGSTGIYNIL